MAINKQNNSAYHYSLVRYLVPETMSYQTLIERRVYAVQSRDLTKLVGTVPILVDFIIWVHRNMDIGMKFANVKL